MKFVILKNLIDIDAIKDFQTIRLVGVLISTDFFLMTICS